MLKYEKEKEKAAFKQLTFKQKREHIWEYYRLMILGIIAAVICLGWALNHYIINPPKDASIAIVFHSYQVDEEAYKALDQDLEEKFPELVTKREDIQEFTCMVGLNDPETEYAATMKIMAMIAGHDVDIIVGDFDAVHIDAANSYLAPLDELFTPEELAVLEKAAYVQENAEPDRTGIVVVEPIDMDTDGQYYTMEAHPYMIDISGNTSCHEILTGQAAYAGVIYDGDHLEDAKRVFWYLVTGEMYGE